MARLQARQSRGFTLIELMIVISMIMILIAIAVKMTSAGPVFSGIRMSLEGAQRFAAEPVSPLPGRSNY